MTLKASWPCPRQRVSVWRCRRSSGGSFLGRSAAATWVWRLGSLRHEAQPASQKSRARFVPFFKLLFVGLDFRPEKTCLRTVTAKLLQQIQIAELPLGLLVADVNVLVSVIGDQCVYHVYSYGSTWVFFPSGAGQ